MIMANVCANCKFWKRDKSNPTGRAECRRNAPFAVYDNGTHTWENSWILTNYDDWCGDFELKYFTEEEGENQDE